MPARSAGRSPLTVAESPFNAPYDPPAAGGGAGERNQQHKAYRAARRHSLVVRLLRFLLPALGALSLAVIVLLSWISTPSRFDVTIAGKSISVNGIVMDRPTLTGFDKDNRRYRVSATTAIQTITSPDEIRLNDIIAEITLPGQGAATITAGGGDYDNKASMLKLIGGIKVDSTMGYQVSLKNAEIDLRAGRLVSRNPVTIRYQDSEITGDTMTVTDGGRVIVLEGRVESRLLPPKRQAGAPDRGSEAVKDGPAAPQTITDLIESTER